MKPGATPTNTFTLPFVPSADTKFRVVYAQGEEYKEKVLFVKKTSDCQINSNQLTVRLSVDETLKIDSTPKWSLGRFQPFPVKIQVGIKTPGKDIIWSDIITTTPGRVLDPDWEE